jgi:hypothetical protein
MYGEPIVPDAPPIIVFLSNDEEIEEEGKKMRHCVGSYTTRCKNRQSFVYHYNDGKNEGTIELNENKGIAQFFGYRNQGMPQECWGNVISWTKGRNPLNAKEMEEQKDTQEMTETYANLLHLTKHIGKLKHIFGD